MRLGNCGASAGQQPQAPSLLLVMLKQKRIRPPGRNPAASPSHCTAGCWKSLSAPRAPNLVRDRKGNARLAGSESERLQHLSIASGARHERSVISQGRHRGHCPNRIREQGHRGPELPPSKAAARYHIRGRNCQAIIVLVHPGTNIPSPVILTAPRTP